MGGVDITNTAYNNGVITINSVTGNVTITAIAKKNSGALLPSDGLLANFDFRNKEMTSYNLSGWGNVYNVMMRQVIILLLEGLLKQQVKAVLDSICLEMFAKKIMKAN